MESDQQKFGKRVRSYRESRGLSQEGLGALTGLHRTYIGSVECGRRNVSLKSIHKLARALKVPASDLLD